MFVPLQFNKGNLQRLIVNVTGVVNSWSGGTTGLTPVGASGGNVVLGGVLNVVNGGTGVTTSTGTGSVVLNTSATLVTPVIGAATGTSLVLTNNIETGTYAIIGRNLSPTVGGSTAYGARFFNATAIGVFTGTGSPTVTAPRGSLYLRNEGLPYYNTDGAVAWSPIAGFTATKVTVFTNSGTWFVDPRTLAVQMETWGGGGAGGSVNTSGSTATCNGGGGGAGGYSRTTSLKVTVGSSQVVTIGAAGAPGAAGSNPGGNGGDTSVGALCIAKGGTGGGFGNAAITDGGSGAGGIAGTGDITGTGMNGDSAMNTASVSLFASFSGGTGGSSALGGGGACILSNIAGGTSVAGVAGTGKGAGGSGAQSFSSGGSKAGGAGTAGYVVITEYLAA